MLRQDPLTGRWVIVAAARDARPNEFQVRGRAASPLTACPFCPGHEDQTTPEILALGRPSDRPANSPGWRLRVFANLYPALVPTGAPVPFGVTADQPDVFFGHAVGVGQHEVVVYTPDHEAGPAVLPPDRLAELLGVLRERSRVFAQHPDVRYVSPFCNHGPDAGATLRHPHMQIIGAPRVPLLAVAKAQRFASYRADHGRCMVCDLALAERASGARLIAENDLWTVVMPWASRFPWEMLFMPRRHGPSWNQAPDAELAALAEVLAPALRALQTIHGDLSLNLVIHGAAVDAAGNDEDPESYHWHLEVLPRLSRPAGFEVGTGYTINSVVPEEAARHMRRKWDQT
jgi:UDPglucose--hexose-1-phosphate uridylyltransferase